MSGNFQTSFIAGQCDGTMPLCAKNDEDPSMSVILILTTYGERVETKRWIGSKAGRFTRPRLSSFSVRISEYINVVLVSFQQHPSQQMDEMHGMTKKNRMKGTNLTRGSWLDTC